MSSAGGPSGDVAASAEPASVPPVVEVEIDKDAPAAASAEGDSKAAPAKTKRLAAGREAAAASSVTLRSAGVATSKALAGASSAKKKKKPIEPLMPSSPASPAGQPAAAAVEEVPASGEPFDPAVDLPMYRPGMDWFVLRVASNKESYVRETLLKKVQIEGMSDIVGRIMVPTEKTKTLKAGKTRITETKLYPGYVFVEMRLEPDGRIPQDVFFLIKETTGVGDFVGTAGRPTPMGAPEVEKMLFDSRKPEETPTVKMEFLPGDHVTIKEGPFQNYSGTVDETVPEKGLVRVLVTIFGRQAPVELEYWQIAKAEEG
jgi:transcriptional antiterminator NusG